MPKISNVEGGGGGGGVSEGEVKTLIKNNARPQAKVKTLAKQKEVIKLNWEEGPNFEVGLEGPTYSLEWTKLPTYPEIGEVELIVEAAHTAEFKEVKIEGGGNKVEWVGGALVPSSKENKRTLITYAWNPTKKVLELSGESSYTPEIAATSEVFMAPVAAGGNDTNAGTSGAAPVKTFKRALEVLEGSKTTGAEEFTIGTIKLAPGKYTVASERKEIEISAEKKCPVVEVPTFKEKLTEAEKFAKGFLFSPEFTAASPLGSASSRQISEVIEGKKEGIEEAATVKPEAGSKKTYFILTKATGTPTETQKCWAIKQAVTLPPTVRIEGTGYMVGRKKIREEETAYGTVIEDTGEGVSFLIEPGSIKENQAGRETPFQNLSFIGTKTGEFEAAAKSALFPYFSEGTWNCMPKFITSSYFVFAGLVVGINNLDEGMLDCVQIFYNGQKEGKIDGFTTTTYGLKIVPGSNTVTWTARDLACVANFGIGCDSYGMISLGGHYGHAFKSGSTGGVAARLGTSACPCVMICDYSEGAELANYEVNNASFIGSRTQSQGSQPKTKVTEAPTGIIVKAGGYLNYQEGYFVGAQYTKCLIEEGAESTITWKNIQFENSVKATTPLIERNLKTWAKNIPITAGQSQGSVGVSAKTKEPMGNCTPTPAAVQAKETTGLKEIKEGVTWANEWSVNGRLRIPVEFKKTTGVVLFSIGPEVGGTQIKGKNYSPSGPSKVGESLIKVATAVARGAVVGGMLVFPEISAGQTTIKALTPYWIIKAEETAVEISTTKGGAALKVEGAELLVAGTKVAFMETREYKPGVESAIVPLDGGEIQINATEQISLLAFEAAIKEGMIRAA